MTSGLVKTLAGSLSGIVGTNNFGYLDGIGTAALFNSPMGVAMDAGGTFAIAVDSQNSLLRRVNLSSGLVTTLAGNITGGSVGSNNQGHADGLGTSASFKFPVGVAVDSTGSVAIIVRVRGDIITNGGGGGGAGRRQAVAVTAVRVAPCLTMAVIPAL